VEDLDYLAAKAPWVKSLFMNVRDYTAGSWVPLVERAQSRGYACGPWARTTDAEDNWNPQMVDELVRIADLWSGPLIVNSEAEIKGSGSTITKFIAGSIGTRDGAVSMEPWPFANVDWKPIGHLPVLPQIFGAQWSDDAAVAKAEWHRVGVERVFYTFGAFGGSSPSTYRLQAPFSIYPADAPMASYSLEAWKPTAIGFDPTDGTSEPPPQNAAQLAPLYRQKIAELAREWEALEPSETPEARLTIIRRIAESKELPWRQCRGAIADALDEVGVPE
jgi:hypothetical protein